MNDDLRAALGEALDADAGNDPESTHAPDPEPSGEPATATASAPASEPSADGTVRDSLGRFVPKAVATPPAASTELLAPVAGGTPTPEPSAAPAAAPAIAAPVGWNPAVRAEHWGNIPPAVQQEVLRREQAFDQAFRQTAQVREVGESFMQAVQPYQMAIQAEGVDPITAVTNLMQVATTLRFGTGREKAGLIAKLVQTYGVDIQGLDDALVGNQPPEGAADNRATIQQAVQQALQPIMQAAQQRQQQATQHAEGEARNELVSFSQDPKNEFYADLRGTMADLIEVAGRQGTALSLKDAYDRAAVLHPDISRVMMARRQGVNAQALTQAARTAKAAAVSVRGSAPVGNPSGPEPSSIRESIEAAIESHSRL